MKLAFAVETFSAALPAILFYEKAHAAEVGDLEGRVSIDLYQGLEQAGALLTVLGRCPDGIIYAYFVATVYRALNLPFVGAETKLIYMDPAVRGANFRAMDRFYRTALRDLGAKRLYTGLRISRQVPLFERLGYRQAETIMEIDL